MSIVGSKSKQKRPKPVVLSLSTDAQNEAEYECMPFFVDLPTMPPTQVEHLRETGLLHHRDGSLDICLLAEKHTKYLEQTWMADMERPLRMSFVSLDASRPWMLYWTMHACDLMGHSPSEEACQNIVSTLKSCWTPVTIGFTMKQVRDDDILQNAAQSTPSASTSSVPNNNNNSDNMICDFQGGGFGGGPGQIAHAATTYGAVLSLCIIAQSNKDAAAPSRQQALNLLTSIRFPLYVWMRSLQQPDGAYVMHHDGERDVRATYCLMAVAKLLGIMTTPHLVNPTVVDFVAQCQTWEGGFGGEPGAEAHGGYAFCATAALYLMNQSAALDAVDVDTLTDWLARRQMSYEGGFNGRSNKLVDGCYSFWQGGALAIVSMHHFLRREKESAASGNQASSSSTTDEDPWFAGRKAPLLSDEGMLERYILLCGQEVSGGLRDKPSKRRDFYHSCYCLSGLSVAQSSLDEADGLSFGHERAARLHATHPCYNIRIERAQAIVNYFKNTAVHNLPMNANS